MVVDAQLDRVAQAIYKAAGGKYAKWTASSSAGKWERCGRAAIAAMDPPKTAPPPAPTAGQRYTPLVPGVRPDGSWRPGSDSSPFNMLIVDRPKLAERSAAQVAFMASRGKVSDVFVGDGGSAQDYGHAVYYAKDTDPVFTLRNGNGWGNLQSGAKLRIPVGAVPAGFPHIDPESMDNHMAVVQPDGQIVSMWHAQVPKNGVVVAESASIVDVGGDLLKAENTAAQFAAVGGVIRCEEMLAGTLDHALFGVFPEARGFVWPAGHGSHDSSNPSAPPIGARLQYTAGLGADAATSEIVKAIAGKSWPGWAKLIATAMARHGVLLGDCGGSNIGLRLGVESSVVYGDKRPWDEVGKQAEVKAPRTDDGVGYWSLPLSRYVSMSDFRVVAP